MHPLRALLVLTLPTVALAAPVTVSHSGYLLGATDQPLDTPATTLGFSLWDAASAGNQVWPATGESTCTVAVKAGYYATRLDGAGIGCGAGLDSTHLPPGAPRWLEVSVTGITLTPRVLLAAAPAATVAATSLDTQALAAQLAATGTINTTGNPVDWTQLKSVPAGVATGTLSGDVTGGATTTSVTALRGKPIAATAPTDQQILVYSTGTGAWVPTTVSLSGTLAGDVTGSTSASSVTALRGRAISATPPNDGEALVWNQASNTWVSAPAPAAGTLAGDVTGAAGSNTVAKIRGKPVAATAPTDLQVLQYRSGTNEWAPTSIAGGTIAGTGYAYYSGYSTTASLTWSSPTFTGVHNVIALTDRFSAGVSRSNSSFTFTYPGLYQASFRTDAWGASQYLTFRLRRTNGTPATLLQYTTYSGYADGPNPSRDQPPGQLGGLFQVSAGDVIALEYAVKNGTTGAWTSSNPIDGETMVTAQLDLVLLQSGLACQTAGTATAPYASCKALHQDCPSLPSATYTLNAGNGPFTARCEMAVDGGGWTQVFVSTAANLNSTTVDYTVTDTALRNAATEALVAFVDGAQNIQVNYARLALPSEWKVKAPFQYAGSSVTTAVAVNGAAPSNTTVVYGYGNWSGAPCNNTWSAGNWGKFCVLGTAAPYYSGFGTTTAEYCVASNVDYNLANCSAANQFSIWVR